MKPLRFQFIGGLQQAGSHRRIDWLPTELGLVRRLERESNAEEVAETLLVLFGNVDAAEEALNQALRQRREAAREFWQEVITYFMQVRG